MRESAPMIHRPSRMGNEHTGMPLRLDVASPV